MKQSISGNWIRIDPLMINNYDNLTDFRNSTPVRQQSVAVILGRDSKFQVVCR